MRIGPSPARENAQFDPQSVRSPPIVLTRLPIDKTTVSDRKRIAPPLPPPPSLDPLPPSAVIDPTVPRLIWVGEAMRIAPAPAAPLAWNVTLELPPDPPIRGSAPELPYVAPFAPDGHQV